MRFIYPLMLASSSLLLTACDLDSDLDVDEDYQHIRVYKDDQKLACQPESAISLAEDALKLANQEIEIHCSQKGNDGFAYPESCGSDTGSINIYTIHQGDLEKAQSAGFERLKHLPQAQFNPRCELQVIPDGYKYKLIRQVKLQIDKWNNTGLEDYQFNYQRSFLDCPNVTAPPEVRITVEQNQITEVYDLENQTFINDLSEYSTVDELLETFKLQLWMTPKAAGLNPNDAYQLPHYNSFGVPLDYYFDQGSNQCDAPVTHVSNFVDLS